MGHTDADPSVRLAEENDRAVRFGLVMSQMGVASKEEVFPHGIRHEPVLRSLSELSEYRFRKKQLEDFEKQLNGSNIAKWWNPLSWFGSRKVHPTLLEKPTSPPMRAKHTASDSGDARAAFEDKTVAETVSPVVYEDATSSTNAGDDATKWVDIPNVKLDTRPLTDDEVSGLPHAVRLQRSALLDGEKEIHRMLDTIEKTRLRYLRASRSIKCESEIVNVIACYEDAKKAGRQESALRCGLIVEALEKCAARVAHDHLHSEQH